MAIANNGGINIGVHRYFELVILFNKYLLNVYYVPAIVLGAVLVNKTDRNHCPHGTYFMVRGTFYKQDKK